MSHDSGGNVVRRCLLTMTLLVTACSAPPATITPPSAAPSPTGAQVIEIPLSPPPAALDSGSQPLLLDKLVPFREETGLFSLRIPEGWVAQRQPPAQPGSDVRVGYVFQPLVGSGLVTVTQFDNGTPPAALGQTINSVLKLTGWPSQPGYRELGRENVLGREGNAMRVEIVYQRANGLSMHSLALFQIDGTTFSMINFAVEEGDWLANEPLIREVLASYQVPAAQDGPS